MQIELLKLKLMNSLFRTVDRRKTLLCSYLSVFMKACLRRTSIWNSEVNLNQMEINQLSELNMHECTWEGISSKGEEPEGLCASPLNVTAEEGKGVPVLHCISDHSWDFPSAEGSESFAPYREDSHHGDSSNIAEYHATAEDLAYTLDDISMSWDFVTENTVGAEKRHQTEPEGEGEGNNGHAYEVKFMLKVDEVIAKMSFDTEQVLVDALAVAILVHERDDRLDPILKLVHKYSLIPCEHYTVDVLSSNRIAAALVRASTNAIDREKQSTLINLAVKLPAKRGSLMDKTARLFFNHTCINRSTLGMSPALYSVLTFRDLEHSRMMSLFASYGSAEFDVYVAASHLMRGMVKYECKFMGRCPKDMNFEHPSSLSMGCLKVLKRNLPKPEYLLALFAVALSLNEDNSVNLPIQSSLGRVDSANLILHKIDRILKKYLNPGPFHGAVTWMSGKNRSSCETKTLMSLLSQHVLSSTVTDRSISAAVHGVPMSISMGGGVTQKLLAYAAVADLEGHALVYILKTYWAVTLLYSSSLRDCMGSFDHTLMLQTGYACRQIYATENHLSLALQASSSIPRASTVRHVLYKLKIAFSASDLDLADAITVLSKALTKGFCNRDIFQGTNTFYTSLKKQCSNSKIIHKSKSV